MASTCQRTVSEMVRLLKADLTLYARLYDQPTKLVEYYCLNVNDTPAWLDNPTHFVWDAANLALERMEPS